MRIVFACLIFVFSAHFAKALEADTLLKRCVDEGPFNVADGLSKQDWEELWEMVESGDEKWFDASVCLSHAIFFARENYILGSGGGDEDIEDYIWWGLQEAWTSVLLNKPETILNNKLRIPLWAACGYPLRSESRGIEWVDEYLEKALAALNAVEGDYSGKRECEFYLRLDYERLLSDIIYSLQP